MSKVKTQCPVCGFTARTDAPPPACPQCGADLVHPGIEVVLKKIHCGFATTKMNGTAGWLYLTNYRLFWIKAAGSGMGGALGGLAGALIENAVNAGKSGAMAFCLPLADIHSLTDDKAGLMKALLLTSRTYGTIGKLALSKRDEWRDAVGQAIMQYANQ